MDIVTLQAARAAAKKDGNESYVQKVPTSLSTLMAGIASRTTTPCRIAFTGSSTTAGSNASAEANRWVNRFITNLQNAYPSGLGVETSVIASTSADFGTLSAAGGIHGYNAAEGGTMASNYLTPAEATKVAALNPVAIFHMVGSNDFANGVTPAAYKASMLTVLSDLKSKLTKPCVQIIIHSYERYDTSSYAYSWSAYKNALSEIAQTDPDNIILLDLSGAYKKIGIPSTDPLGFMASDKIHQVDTGHAFMADLIRRGLSLPAQTISIATPVVQRTLSRITSDAFTGSGEIVGRTSDAGLGGTGKVYQGTPTGTMTATSGAFTRANAGSPAFVGWPETVMDLEISAVIAAVTTNDGVLLDLHRAGADVASSPNAYRLGMNPNGASAMYKRINGTVTPLGAAFTVAAGDRVALRYYKGTLEARVNGVLVASATDGSITTPGFAGVALGGAATPVSLKALALDAVT